MYKVNLVLGATSHVFSEIDLTCTYEGKELRNGEIWHVNKCKTCHCRNGVIKCKDKTCKNLPCTLMITPEGECCPVCRGCLSNSGNLYNESSVWQEDDCTTCTCQDGQAQCQSEMCSVHCTNPKYLPGQCCPVCPEDAPTGFSEMCSGLEFCSLTCEKGLVQTSGGCYLCRCKEEKCTLDCQFGLKADAEGNILCECKGAEDRCAPWEEEQCEKKCEYGYKRSRDGCLKCKCKKCPQFNCIKRCLHGHLLNDEGCPLCKCKDTAVTELISSNFEPENIEGKSCMSWDGSRHEDGESWSDGCRLCYCHNGAEMCSLIACPVPHCPNPVFRIGDCCPTCPGLTIISDETGNELCQSSQGQYYVEGETWKMDQCTQCMCHKGTILCETPSCPPVICHYPVKPEGQCCAICRETDIKISTPNQHNFHHNHCMLSTGISYKHGEVWHSTPCQSCICKDGQIHCYNQMCLPLNCNRTVQKKGYCCPSCVESGKPKICIHSGVTYEAGEKWEGDNCTQCSCVNGQTKCSPLSCPNLNCTYMLRKRGQCCPECADKSQLHSLFHGNLGTYKEKNMLNRTAISRSRSSADANLAGIAVLGIIVLILAIIIFILVIYFMKQRFTYKLKQQPKATTPDLQGHVPFLSEPIKKTSSSEKHFLEILYPNVTPEEGREDRICNNYTEIMFRDQAKDNLKDTNGHFLSSKII